MLSTFDRVRVPSLEVTNTQSPLLCLRLHREEALSDAFVWRRSVWRLSVCLSRTSGLRREQRCIGRLEFAQR